MKNTLLIACLLTLGCSAEFEGHASASTEPLGCLVPTGMAHTDCTGACSDAPEFVPSACFECGDSLVVGQNWSSVVTVDREPCPGTGSLFRFEVPPNRRARFFSSSDEVTFRVIDASSDVAGADFEYENRTGEMVVVIALGDLAEPVWLAAELAE
jgi:hypothetical protein